MYKVYDKCAGCEKQFDKKGKNFGVGSRNNNKNIGYCLECTPECPLVKVFKK